MLLSGLTQNLKGKGRNSILALEIGALGFQDFTASEFVFRIF
jgi:hypothetical protein